MPKTPYKSRAARVASNLILTYNLRVPIPIERVASLHGIEVVRTPNLRCNGVPASGLLLQAEGRRICAVEATDKHERQRFTIAHECGHYLLGHQGDAIPGRNGSEFVERILPRNERSGMAIDSREIEANAFASEVLMPEAEVRLRVPFPLQVHDPFDEDEIGSLAREFEVSFTAMTNRLNFLGLLQG